MKPKRLHQAAQIKVPREKMWEILSQYGNVSLFHAGVVKSLKEHGSRDQASLGCERICNIVDMGMKITLKERIVDYVEGESYKYEVYDWKNFPIQQMSFGFSIIDSTPATTTLAIDIEYQAKPAVLTPLLAGKMRTLARDVLLGYKHYAETGEKRVPIRELRNLYRTYKEPAAQYS
jgi:hypothetical protein